MSVDELTHTIKHMVDQQTQQRKPFAYGHIAIYNPLKGVRVIYPSIRNEDGAPTQSPWMPLGTCWAGPPGQPGFGFQVVPYGGASLDNPTAGELVIVDVIENNYGISFAASMAFSQAAQPPMTGLLAGEAVMQGPAGSFLRLHQNGDIEINTQANASGNTVVNATNVNLIATGTVNVVATAIKLCAALTDALQAFCTTAFKVWAQGHTHSGVQSGGSNSGPPTSPPPGNSLTTIVSGE